MSESFLILCKSPSESSSSLVANLSEWGDVEVISDAQTEDAIWHPDEVMEGFTSLNGYSRAHRPVIAWERAWKHLDLTSGACPANVWPMEDDVAGSAGSWSRVVEETVSPGSGLDSALARISSVGFQYDQAGRRKTAAREDNIMWDYDYNARSEVGGADKTTGFAAVPGLSFDNVYDGIGNRTSAPYGTGSNRASLGYSPNALNPYANTTHSGKFDILTRSDAAVTAMAPPAEATVNGITQDGSLYQACLTAANGSSGKYGTTQLLRGGSAAGTVKTWVRPAGYSLVYDLDDNLTNDGRWVDGGDGENRLISMTPSSTALSPGGAPNISLTFYYDYLGTEIHISLNE